MLPREPIRGESDLLINWFFESELTASPVSSRNYISGEVISTESDPCSTIERLAELRIEVIAGVVRTIANRNEDVIAHHERPPVIPTLVWFPLNSWHQSWRLWARLNVAGDVQSNFNATSSANDNTRHEGREPRYQSSIG